MASGDRKHESKIICILFIQYLHLIFQAKLESKTQEAEKKREGERIERQKAEVINDKLVTEKAELEEALARGDEVVREMASKVKGLETEKNQLDKHVILFKISCCP